MTGNNLSKKESWAKLKGYEDQKRHQVPLCATRRRTTFPDEKDALQKLLKFNNPHVKRVVEVEVDVQSR